MLICEISFYNGNRFLGGVGGFGILTFTACLGLTTTFLDCCFTTFWGFGFFACFLGVEFTQTFLT
ncbi:hypothetical protein E3U36_12115 (plasmid) [Arsenophonus endosymbiont of Aphis craccivora]|nr:hypothetical protein E3U36_12115 [Arsenophonus endosymbiont of Aphis craccivora]